MDWSQGEYYRAALQTAVNIAADALRMEDPKAALALQEAHVLTLTASDDFVGASVHFFPDEDRSMRMFHTYGVDELTDPPAEAVVDDLKERARFVSRRPVYDPEQIDRLVNRAAAIAASSRDIPAVDSVLVALDEWRRDHDTATLEKVLQASGSQASEELGVFLNAAQSFSELLTKWPDAIIRIMISVRLAQYLIDSTGFGIPQPVNSNWQQENLRELSKLLKAHDKHREINEVTNLSGAEP